MNPYTPPAADVALEYSAPEVPDEVLKKIKGAWVAGIISGVVTFLFTLAALNGAKAAGFNAWNFIDVVLIFGLAFGIYKKSRACAVSMMIYFVVSKILIVVETGSFGGSVMAIIFIYYYAQGISGTFAYHKLMKE
jgi:serine/threonine-protein kinase